jgi:hypothetical protein
VTGIDDPRNMKRKIDMSAIPHDPRWSWVEICTFSGDQTWIRGKCNHLNPIEVRNVITEDLVAWICPDCDRSWRVIDVYGDAPPPEPNFVDRYANPRLIGGDP